MPFATTNVIKGVKDVASKWKKPIVGWITLNVDIAAFERAGAFSMVRRDSAGTFLDASVFHQPFITDVWFSRLWQFVRHCHRLKAEIGSTFLWNLIVKLQFMLLTLILVLILVLVLLFQIVRLN